MTSVRFEGNDRCGVCGGQLSKRSPILVLVLAAKACAGHLRCMVDGFSLTELAEEVIP